MKKNGLGKGLEALLPTYDSVSGENNDNGIIEVKINDIEPNVNQPRKNFNDEKLTALSESIKENGIIQPIIVKKEGDIYRIVAGERRWRAARIVGLTKVPVIIGDYTDKQLMEIALIENIQREDLNPIEEAQAFEKLINVYGLTQDGLSKTIGRSRPAVTNTMRLLALDSSIQKYLISGDISSGHARAIIPVNDVKMQKEIIEKIIEYSLNVRDTEKLVKKLTQETKETNKGDKDENIIVIEENLKSILGTKVQIMNKKGKGKILIEYYSNDELERIIEIMENNVKKAAF